METSEPKGGFRNVIILSIVSFLNDLSSEMIMPILPMFLESLNASGAIIGLVGGLRESVSSIMKVLCGYWSDKTGKRKIFVYAGYATSSVFKLFLGFSKTPASAVVFSSMERTGKGLRTAARDAIIADSVAATHRGKGFGIHRGLETIGAILGRCCLSFSCSLQDSLSKTSYSSQRSQVSRRLFRFALSGNPKHDD